MRSTLPFVACEAINAETKFYELGDGVVRADPPQNIIRMSLIGVLNVRDGSAPPPTGYFGVSRHRD